jgi:hypothetical protein
LVDKPISQMSKGEASALIDRLRAMLPEQPQTSDEREGRYAATGPYRNGTGRN